jgi:hypothetical protein
MPTNAQHCKFAGCGREIVSSLDGEGYCRGHFISVCETRLEKYEQMHKAHSLSATDKEAVRRFIEECVRNVDQFEHDVRDLDEAQRKSLLNISVWANDMGRQLRRSPRKAAALTLRLYGENSDGPWEKEARTVLLSRHGASIVCGRIEKPGEDLQIERIDTGEKAQARIVWHSLLGEEGVRMGVEFVDCDNFWGLDWTEAAKT